MVTTKTYIKDGVYYSAETYYGLSTDTKPTKCGNGSCFIEIDTCYCYFFDAENKEWYLVTV